MDETIGQGGGLAALAPRRIGEILGAAFQWWHAAFTLLVAGLITSTRHPQGQPPGDSRLTPQVADANVGHQCPAPHLHVHRPSRTWGGVRLPIGGEHKMDATNATPSAPATAVAVDDDGPKTATTPKPR
jgi:hypothetical protein